MKLPKLFIIIEGYLPPRQFQGMIIEEEPCTSLKMNNICYEKINNYCAHDIIIQGMRHFCELIHDAVAIAQTYGIDIHLIIPCWVRIYCIRMKYPRCGLRCLKSVIFYE